MNIVFQYLMPTVVCRRVISPQLKNVVPRSLLLTGLWGGTHMALARRRVARRAELNITK